MLYINGNDLVKRQKADDAQSIKDWPEPRDFIQGARKKRILTYGQKKNVYNI